MSDKIWAKDAKGPRDRRRARGRPRRWRDELDSQLASQVGLASKGTQSRGVAERKGVLYPAVGHYRPTINNNNEYYSNKPKKCALYFEGELLTLTYMVRKYNCFSGKVIFLCKVPTAIFSEKLYETLPTQIIKLRQYVYVMYFFSTTVPWGIIIYFALLSTNTYYNKSYRIV